MTNTYEDGIRKAVHDSQVILHRLLVEMMDGYSETAKIRPIIENEFRERIELWSKFEDGEIAEKHL